MATFYEELSDFENRAFRQLRSRQSHLVGISGFNRNRDLFKRGKSEHEGDITKRRSLGLASGAAGTVEGNEDAILHKAKYEGVEKIKPPKPPKKPKPYVDPRSLFGTDEDYEDMYQFLAVGLFNPNLKEYQELTTALKGNPILSSPRYQQLKEEGKKKYKTAIKKWEPLDREYKTALEDVNAYNAGFKQQQKKFKESKVKASGVARSAGKGRGGGQGGGQGVSQMSTSPGLSFIDRPNTVWL